MPPATVSRSGEELMTWPGIVKLPNGGKLNTKGSKSGWPMFLSSVALSAVSGSAVQSSRPVLPNSTVLPAGASSAAKSSCPLKNVSPVGFDAVPGTAETFRKVTASKLQTSRSVPAPPGLAEKTRRPFALMRPCGSSKSRTGGPPVVWPGTADGTPAFTDRQSTRSPAAGSKALK